MDKEIRLLMIDDDEEDFIILKDEIAGMQTMKASLDWVSSIEKAKKQCTQKEYDLFLTDYNLGKDNSAIDFLKYLKSNDISTPVVILTGIDSIEADIAAMQAGALDFLVKGKIDAKTLERCIRYAMAHKANEKRLLSVQSELRQALNQLKTHQERLLEMKNLESIKKLSGAIAHEFSQPLQALHFKLQLMQNQTKNKHIDDCLELVDRLMTLQMKMRNITVLQDKSYLDDSILDIDASSADKTDDAQMPKRILIVDDETYIVETLAEMLQLKGYECDGVESGEEALELLEKNEYSIIVSDIFMPKMSGTEFFKKVKAKNIQAKFVFMTGYELTEEIRQITMQADALLIKPVTYDQFSDVFARLDSHRN